MRTPLLIPVIALSVLLSLPIAAGAATVAPIDSTWSTAGQAQVVYGNTGGSSTDLWFDGAGRLYLVHGVKPKMMARLTAAGQLDTTWATRGLRDVTGFVTFVAGSRAFLADVVSGPKGTELTRLTDRGAIDTTFGTRGSIQLRAPVLGAPWQEVAWSYPELVRVQNGILSVVTGVMWNDGQTERPQLYVSRAPVASMTLRNPSFTSTTIEGPRAYDVLDSIGRPWYFNGRLQRFGTSGLETPEIDAPLSSDVWPMLAPHGSGVVLLGVAADSPTWVLLKYDETGALDSSFGTNGRVDLPSSVSTSRGYGQLLRTNAAGQIDVALGASRSADVELHRLDGAGRPVVGFGSNGVIALKATSPLNEVGRRRVMFDAADRAYLDVPFDSGRNKVSSVRRFATDAADLTVSLSATSAAAGWKRLNVSVTNRGPRNARNVIVEVRPPVGVSAKAPVSDDASCRTVSTRTGQVVRCAIAASAVGSSKSMRVDVRPAAGAHPTITAACSTRSRRDLRPASNVRRLAL